MAWGERDIEFEERMVEEDQGFMDEARAYGESVPLIVNPDGRFEEGLEGDWG